MFPCFSPATIIMDSKLKSLKVVDLKDILQKANVAVPAKANKQDLIAKVVASQAAIDVYNKQQNPGAADDLVCTLYLFLRAQILITCPVGPSRRASPRCNTCVPRLTDPLYSFDWEGDESAPPAKEAPASKPPAPEPAKAAKPASKAAAKPPSKAAAKSVC